MNYKDYFRKLKDDRDYQEVEKELKVVLDMADDILSLRMEKGWSQAELAKRAGTKQANISRLESGLSNPSVNFLQKVAKALDTNLSVSFQEIPTKRIYLATDAANQSQESYLVGNWPTAKIYQSFDHSSS